MQATVAVFLNETHIEYFDLGIDPLIMENPKHWDYEKSLSSARRLIDSIGMAIDSEYSEYNEFGDPITCLFIRPSAN